MKMTVIGLGYLGVTHAIAMAKIGHTVYGVDPDVNKINSLSSGVIPFYEPGLDEELPLLIQEGRINFSTNHTDSSKYAEIHWVCVGTPQEKESEKADMSFLDAALREVMPFAKSESIIVGKSTVPVGTHKKLMEIISEYNPSVRLAWNPEFLREGTALQDSLNPDRIVIGDNNDGSYQIVVNAYQDIIKENTPLVHTNLPTAELIKVASNSFLATKISFINAVAEISEVSGADVRQIAEAMGYDERIGNKFLRSGIGFGGGCLPKDIRAFKANASELGLSKSFNFLNEIDIINSRRKEKVINMVLEELIDLKGKVISILGASFKPNSDDIRESPALEIALKLAQLGAVIKIHDPKALKNVEALKTNLIIKEDVYEIFASSEMILHLTEWPEYKKLNLDKVSMLVKTRNIIDGRLSLESKMWEGYGFKFEYLGVGR